LIQKKASVFVYSSLPAEFVRRAHLIPCADIASTVCNLLSQYPDTGNAPRVAAIPQGPLTIPTLVA
jgi:hypothetical protein